MLVVGPNSAIDAYWTLDRLRPGQVNRAQAAFDTAGGKANNLSRALRRLGGRPLVVGIAAGHQGALMLAGLAREGIAHDYVTAPGETRRNLSLLSCSDRATTVLLEPGQALTGETLDELAAKVDRWAPGVPFVALTGSLPPGAPATLYAQLIRRVRARSDAQIAVDASGEALRHAAGAGLDLLKVNLEEFESAFPGAASDWTAIERQYRRLQRDGLKTLCLTHGPRGAAVLSGEDRFGVRTGVPDLVSAVGAGDTFLAGLLFGLGRGDGLRDAARLASAAAAANLQTLGCGFIEPPSVEACLGRTVLVDPREFLERAA